MVCVNKQNALILLVALVLTTCVSAVAQDTSARLQSARAISSLAEVRDMRRALLVVFRSRVVDASDNERAIIEDVLKADPRPKGRFRWVHMQIARKLDKYKDKYRSLSAAEGLADADYVIYFNVVEFRRILDTVYPYGELFVIVKGTPEQLKPPRRLAGPQGALRGGRDRQSHQRTQSRPRRGLKSYNPEILSWFLQRATGRDV